MHNNVISTYRTRMNDLLARKKYSFSMATSEDVLEEPGVYIIYDANLQSIIYIGRTRNLRRRILGDHRRGNIRGSQFRRALGNRFALKSESSINEYISRNCRFQFIVINEPEERVRLEHFATAILAPILNVQLAQ